MVKFSKFECYGSQLEPCYVFRNVFGEREGEEGTKLVGIITASFKKNGKALPTPAGDDRWASWRNQHPANGNGLVEATREMLQWLRRHRRHDLHVNTEPGRGFNTWDINVTANGGGQPWHQDAQNYGNIVFVWAAGNTCESTVRLGGKKSKDEKTIILYSGDVMAFEGQTWHTVRACVPHTSPFKIPKDWLHNRRLSVLVRQRDAHTKNKTQRPRFLNKK